MCNTIVQQYFKYVYDVTSVTMATTERLERTLLFPVLLIIYKTKSVTYHFYCFFSLLLSERYKKKLSRGTMAMSKKAKTEIQKIPI